MRLASFTGGRNNNFNLIRFVAAFLVLITHSYALTTGNVMTEPLRAYLDMTWGMIAVDVFFIISGFLVTASLLTRKNLQAFVVARFLRIYPALWVMIAFTVVALGLWVTSLSAHDFFIRRETLVFILKNMTMVRDVAYILPGVFETVPFKGTVNGSLWTLPLEIRMYVTLAVVWATMTVFGARREKVTAQAIVLMAISALLLNILFHFFDFARLLHLHLGYMFFVGSAFYVFRERIILSRGIFLAAAIALLLSAFNKDVFYVTYMAVLAYLVFWLAYVPTGIVRQFNRLGDYSYGIYIYAFPVQQSIVMLVPGISSGALMGTAFGITLFFAFLSWHLIESKALSLKSRWTERI